MMLKKFAPRTLILLTGLLPLAGWLIAAEITTPAEVSLAAESLKPKATKPHEPGPDDGRIAYVTARMLEQNHYSRHPLDDEYSEKFFYRYLESLDPQHLDFTQSDIDEFDEYRTKLDDLTLGKGGVADTTPAFRIFNRFLERRRQRVAYVQELLKNEKFTFDTDERALVNRRDEPYPADLDEARKLWRQRLMLEYLQEKIGRLSAKQKKAEADAKNPDAKNDESKVEDDSTSETASTEKKKTDDEEIAELLGKRYNRTLHMFEEWDNQDVLQVYLDSLARVYDPHSSYMNASATENFSINMNLELFGIGAVLTTDLDGYCKIQEVKPGPAMRSGQIKNEDRIIAVAQSNQPPVDVVDMNLNKVVQLIRGPKGTEVRLTIMPAEDRSARKVVKIIRDAIKLEDQEAKAKIIELPGEDGKPMRLGVVDLPSFYASMNLPGSRVYDPKSTTADVAVLLKKLIQEKVSGVILDLRRNGGGSLEEAIRLTGLFIKEGPVVQVRDPNNRVLIDEDDDPSVLYDGPLIVLTSRFSASASEILAGALQDYGRAVIVGDVSTHGKGTVQNLNSLRMHVKSATNDPGTVKITIRKFYRAGGSSTQLKGVLPDIVLPSVLNYSKDIGEASLDNAMKWDNIRSASFDKLNLVDPYLTELVRRSSARISTNQEYAYIREDIEIFKKRQADKSLSLNQAERLREKAADEARQKARDDERRSRPESPEKLFELTVRQAELPGLPPPLAKTNTLASASGVSSASAAQSASVASDQDSVEPEDKAPEVDPMLDEAKQILLDYISLMSKKGTMTANR